MKEMVIKLENLMNRHEGKSSLEFYVEDERAAPEH